MDAPIESELRIPAGPALWLRLRSSSIWLCCASVFYASASYGDVGLLTLPLAIVCTTAGLLGLMRALVKRVTHRWIFEPLAFALALISASVLISSLYSYDFDPDWFRFQIARPYYLCVVALSSHSSPTFHEWHWRGAGFGGVANLEVTLVYDALADPITSSSGHKATQIRPLGGHFFLFNQLLE